MNTKLTLTINEAIIQKAKEYAKGKGRSLSDIIENYLNFLVEEKTNTTASTPITTLLRGSFKAPSDFDYAKILKEELAKKHL